MSFIHARSSFSFSQDVIAFRISAKISTERLLVFNNTDSTVAFMTLLFLIDLRNKGNGFSEDCKENPGISSGISQDFYSVSIYC